MYLIWLMQRAYMEPDNYLNLKKIYLSSHQEKHESVESKSDKGLQEENLYLITHFRSPFRLILHENEIISLDSLPVKLLHLLHVFVLKQEAMVRIRAA